MELDVAFSTVEKYLHSDSHCPAEIFKALHELWEAIEGASTTQILTKLEDYNIALINLDATGDIDLDDVTVTKEYASGVLSEVEAVKDDFNARA